MREDCRNLERAHHTEPRYVRGRKRSNVAALINDAPARRSQELGEQVEAGGFARAVWTNESVDRAARDAQIDAVDCDKAGEFLRKMLGPQDDLVTHAVVPDAH